MSYRRREKAAPSGGRHLFMGAGAHGERRRGPARRAGAPEDRHHQGARVFYPGPVLLSPVAPATTVALLRPGLGTLRAEAARSQQLPDVIRVVDDLEGVADEVDDPPAGPQTRTITRRFRPRHDHARQLPPLRARQLRRSARRRARAKAGAPLPPVRPLPPAYGAPIHAKALGHDMHGDVTLEQVDRA